GSVTLTDPTAFDMVVGTSFSDRIQGGESAALTLIGGGGSDYLAAGSGDTYLQAGISQVVHLDFSAAPLGSHQYSQEERDAIQAGLTRIYAAFDYFFTQDEG